jgi:uncharacterized coiled-coil protein SlyX
MAGAIRTPDSYVNLSVDNMNDDIQPQVDLRQKYDNAVLCYLIHKMDIVTQDLLVKITSEFYTDGEIESAKDVLFKCVPSHRNIKRKGCEKRAQNIVDMLSVLHKTNSDSLPMFGVFDLSRLPPLDMNSIDVTNVTKEIKQLKTNMRDCESQVKHSKIEEISKDMINMKISMSKMETQLAAVVTMLQEDEKKVPKQVPIELKLPPPVERLTPSRILPQTPVYLKPSQDPEGPGARQKQKAIKQQAESMYSHVLKRPPKLVLSKPDTPNEDSPNVKVDEAFKTVTYKKRRRQNLVVGKAGQTGLSSKGRFVSLFVSRLEPDIEAEKIQTYIKSKFNVTFECEKLKTKYDSYASFKLQGFCVDPSVFYKAENWPENILVRRFFSAKNTNLHDNGGTT